MIICYVSGKCKCYWTNMYKDVETFCKENPHRRVIWAFAENSDLLGNDIVMDGKSLLSNKYKTERTDKNETCNS